MGRIFGISDLPVTIVTTPLVPYKIPAPVSGPVRQLPCDDFVGRLRNKIKKQNSVRYFFRRVLNLNSKALKK